ncbi:FecR family protein [Ottowia thiooxydans]|uniref:FecR family protein n=1 Tax=Ottowia thiooxydans TaxID=219182 RepID=UPI0004048DFC|nr:FecR domain-containing protein [Ottowia thiooxydans]
MSKPTFQASDASRTRDEALDWFVRRCSERFGSEDEQSFQSWLAQSPTHQKAFDHWHGEWKAVDAIPQDLRSLLQHNLAFDQASGFARDSSSPQAGAQPLVPNRQRTPQLPMPSRRRIFAPAMAIAGIAAVTGGTGLLAWNHWQSQPLFEQAFSTPRGMQDEVPLPDGTRLRLDSATRVEVAYYRQRREVKLLDGQAVFAVRSDAERPFQVLAGPVRVTVVGTRFAVRHTPQVPGSSGVHVAVEEGRVRVERLMSHAGDSPNVESLTREGILLTAGQQVSSDKVGELSAISRVPAAGIAPWRSNRVSFDNQRLDHALAELARYGDPELLIRDPVVAAMPITGVFDPRDMATFRRVLPASLPVQLKAISGGVAEVVLTR